MIVNADCHVFQLLIVGCVQIGIYDHAVLYLCGESPPKVASPHRLWLLDVPGQNLEVLGVFEDAHLSLSKGEEFVCLNAGILVVLDADGEVFQLLIVDFVQL